MTSRYCRVPGCDHDPDNPTCGPYLPPLREGELQRYAGLIPDGSGLTIEERRVPLPDDRCGVEPGQFEVPEGGLDAIAALRQAKQPSERGWLRPSPGFVRFDERGRAYQVILPDYTAEDRTFENETRPLR